MSRIFINSLVKRNGNFFNRTINEVNVLLRNKCRSEQFYYVDNGEIDPMTDLCDGLHLNDNGNRKFIKKLWNCCDNYNPYLTDDDD